jgi:structural maintenance of chromosome 3 (chondroitin sulfate proteoglycan 6)
VVDTDETASRLLEAMRASDGGRVTFMPLNRLHPQEIQYPEARNVRPIISRLVFDPRFIKAFQQVRCIYLHAYAIFIDEIRCLVRR